MNDDETDFSIFGMTIFAYYGRRAKRGDTLYSGRNIRVPKVSKSEAANFSNTWAEFDTTARRPQRTAPSQILWEDALA